MDGRYASNDSEAILDMVFFMAWHPRQSINVMI